MLSSALNVEQTDATGSKELQIIKPSSELHNLVCFIFLPSIALELFYVQIDML
jgi:hypothetical protein